jgi:Nucleotidyl transferase AbiEii toxin, Type IV TA system
VSGSNAPLPPAAAPVLLQAPDGSMTARLVETVAKVAEAGLGQYALVGGLAVTCRLSQVHRATGDIDTLTETTNPAALELLGRSVGERDGNRIYIDGIKVDVIDTLALDYDAIDGIEGPDRLFLLGHRYALETARPATIMVTHDGSVIAEASTPLATPAGLVATKLHALQTRPDASAPKRATDLYDVYLLAGDYLDEIATDLAAAPLGLGSAVAAALAEAVLDDPTAARRPLAMHEDRRISSITENQLVGRLGPLRDAVR